MSKHSFAPALFTDLTLLISHLHKNTPQIQTINSIYIPVLNKKHNN